jgi:hypothetical protein
MRLLTILSLALMFGVSAHAASLKLSHDQILKYGWADGFQLQPETTPDNRRLANTQRHSWLETFGPAQNLTGATLRYSLPVSDKPAAESPHTLGLAFAANIFPRWYGVTEWYWTAVSDTATKGDVIMVRDGRKLTLHRDTAGSMMMLTVSAP